MVAALMWGVLAIALKISTYFLSTFDIVWSRFAIAFVLLFVYLLFRHRQAFTIFKNPPLKLVIATVCLAVNYFGYMLGLEYTTPSTAQIFIQLGPILFALAGIIIFKEHITWKHIVGFIIITLGFGLFYHEKWMMITNQKQFSLGILLLVLASATWAVFAVFQKGLAHKNSTNQLNLFIYGFCTVLFAPFVHFGHYASLNILQWLLVLFLGLNTLIAYGAIALAFRHLEANKVSVIVILNPIITFLLMYIFNVLNVTWIPPEHFSLVMIIGSAMAMGGAAFVLLFTSKA